MACVCIWVSEGRIEIETFNIGTYSPPASVIVGEKSNEEERYISTNQLDSGLGEHADVLRVDGVVDTKAVSPLLH